MAEPNTGGQLRTSVADMKIGDYIYGYYENGAGWGLGKQVGNEFGYTGFSNNAPTTGWFYFVKVDKGLLIADRVALNTISWNNLNNSGVIEGRPEPSTRWQINGVLRSLGGGNAYADANGNKSLTDKGLGAWPTDNEWDKYVAGMFEGRDDVWHYSSIWTWCQETTALMTDATRRITRGYNTSAPQSVSQPGSSVANTTTGFRPVFEYKEV